MQGHVLIVDDEPNAARVLSAILTGDGHMVSSVADVPAAERLLKSRDIDVIITDLRMPGKDGMQLFEYAVEHFPDIPVIFLTAYGSVDSAVNAVTRGAFYYFIKPPDYVKLKSMVARAVEQRTLKRQVAELRKQVAERDGAGRLIGTSAGMQKIYDTVEAVKNSMSSVLICGETGTGKELIARSLHYGSVRRDRPFVAVNCAAFPRELMESELFGYEKGAFSGASARRVGRFEAAADGTLFLDEIGELELSLQAKLLRALQEKEIERLGSNRKIKVNIRVVSSTNRDLKREIANGSFREDLYYRLNVVQINVPALRERREDIPLLITEFVREFGLNEGRSLRISDEVMKALVGFPWPGNVRQLRNTIERAVVMARGGEITFKHLPEEIMAGLDEQPLSSEPKTLRELEEEAILQALRECDGNKSRVAKKLGISRKTLYKRLDDLGM
ncbi:sigma-54-dependent Fis family transcriptional regulator [Geotalea uraniireducens]|uniref:Sigma-54-dependent Fis family transcriptional regulator n=1 Tax=Geotalea uraniireducens TaxID=351604 RepID=A0ABN6VRN6_9BACT|nr:sigma-54-dependent Fis family transcriptional regulator [Geotalea uraniireducens]